MKDDLRMRLAESVETAVALAEGLVEIDLVDAGRASRRPTPSGSPARSTVSPARARAADLLVQLAARRLPALHRARRAAGDRPRAARPRPEALDRRGRARAVGGGASGYYESLIQAIAERYEVDLDDAVAGAPEEARDFFLHGTGGDRVYVAYRNRFGRRRSYTTRSRGSSRTSSAATARPTRTSRARRSRSTCRCALPGLQGRAAAARVARGHGRRARHPRVHARCRRGRAGLGRGRCELTEHDRRIARLVLREIHERLQFLDNVGVGYLALDRASATLSGGEAQRIRLATQIGSSLVGVLYILDEPSIGLHQRDNERLIGTLERLRDLGNTVLVVEHDEGTMRAADRLVDMGPGAGEHGGHVVAEGTADEVEREPRVGHRPVPRRDARDRGARSAGASPSGYIAIEGAAEHNLKAINVKFPLGVSAASPACPARASRRWSTRSSQGGREPAARDARQRPARTSGSTGSSSSTR